MQDLRRELTPGYESKLPSSSFFPVRFRSSEGEALDYQLRALYYLVDTGAGEAETVGRLEGEGFRPEHLSDYNNREGRFLNSANEWIASQALAFHQSTGGIISVDTLNARAPKDAPPELREQVRSILTSLRSQTGDGSDVVEIAAALLKDYKRRLLHHGLMVVKNDVLVPQADPDRGMEILRECLNEMEGARPTSESLIYTLGQTAAERLLDYQQREENPEAGMGIPTGITPFDSVTGGIKPGEVAIIIGRTGGGKTTLCETISTNAYLLGRNTAYAGKEMYGEFIRRRIEAGLLCCDASNGRVQRRQTHLQGGAVRALETGGLTEELKQRFIEMQMSFQEEDERGHKFWVLEPGSYQTLSDLHGVVAKIKREHGLDLLWVDSLNIQNLGERTERDDLKQGAMVQLLREVGLANHIGVIVDTQERSATWQRRFVDLSEIMMYSNAISHRADHIIRWYCPPSEPKLREFQHMKCRNGRLVDYFCMYAHLDDMVLELAPNGVLSGDCEQRKAQVDDGQRARVLPEPNGEVVPVLRSVPLHT